jgi:hypothetical protein
LAFRGHKKTSYRHQLVRLSRACNCRQEAGKTIALRAPTDKRYIALDRTIIPHLAGGPNVQ